LSPAANQLAAHSDIFRVAITGGIGSGKSTICRLFETLGVSTIDTDQVAHSLTQPGGAAIAPIAQAFGESFILPSGAMDRAAMRSAVFSNAAQKALLEGILHPLIRQGTDALVAEAAGKSPYVLVAIPLLVESLQKNSAQLHQRILLVDCSVDEQRARVMQRSQLALNQVDAIIASQASRAQRLAVANDVVQNRDFQPDVAAQVAALHQLYLRLSAS
jgi:dephospho-CoA kinase